MRAGNVRHRLSDRRTWEPARVPQTPLSHELIVETALQIIDELGLDALSIRGVAARLGVRAPSLYNHIESKKRLCEEIARTLLFSRRPSGVDKDWREYIVQVAVDTRRAILRHPNAAPLLLQYFPRDVLVDSYERSISLYRVPAELHLMITEGIELLTYGSALFCAAYRARKKPAWPDFPHERYPHLAKAIKSANPSHEKMFADLVRRFLSSF
jgi:AcrR family transcriptional regulator